MPAIPDSTRSSITLRLLDHAETHRPQLERVQVRYRGAFAYVAGVLSGGQTIPLCRLRYGGSAHSFGFAIYSAAHDRYQDAVLVTGLPIGTPQEALDTACTVHLAGLGHEPDSRPPTNLRGYPLRRCGWGERLRRVADGRCSGSGVADAAGERRCPRDCDNWRTLRSVMTRHLGAPAAASGLHHPAPLASSAPSASVTSPAPAASSKTAQDGKLYPRYPGYTPRRDGGLAAYETVLARAGFAPVAGIDEAGRGACAGPLVVAAVVLDPARIRRIRGLADSKLLTPAAREEAYAEVLRWAIDWHVVVIGNDQIDATGLHVCNVVGMRRAFAGLRCRPGYVLTDGFPVRGLGVPALAVWKGDRITASVAAASVVAKVSRDRMMRDLHERYPLYGFDQHKGYNTDEHVRALTEYGPCPAHRYSFVNVRAAVASSGPALIDPPDPMDLMADADAEDLSDPDAVLIPAVAGTAGSPVSGTGAFGGNERRMDS